MNIEIPSFSGQSDAETRDAILDIVRQIAGTIVRKGAAPQVVTYVLAYIATELALYLTQNSARVFPVILEAIADAARWKTSKKLEKPAVPDVSNGIH